MKYTEEVASQLYSYFIERLNVKENTKNWLVGDCPHCGKKKKFGINVHINMTNCFVCGVKATPLNLVKQLEEYNTFNEVMNLLNKYDSFSIDISDSLRDQNETHEDKIKIVQALPKEYKLIGLYDSKLEKIARAQLKKRGFSVNRAMMLGIGYCGTGEHAQRLIIPFYQGGKIVYYNSRSLLKIGVKYKNPDEESFGIGKGHVIYNYDALNFYNKIWLFEGVFNAITIGSNATATGGKILSPWQIDQYLKSKCKKLVIALDDDAYAEALRLALKFGPYKMIKILKFPKGKDANDLGRKATMKLEKKTPYMTYKEIYSEYLNFMAQQ